MDPKKIIKIAKKRELDAIAITDHNQIEGALEAQRYANGKILVIIGEEVFTSSGDILGLFLKERVTAFEAKEAVAHIKSQGGIAIKPHPFVDTMSIEEDVCKMLNGCEGFNARHAKTSHCEGPLGDPKVAEFARHYNLALTASSDAHFYSEIGNARTIIEANSLEEIKQQILNKKTTLTGKRSSRIPFYASGLLKSIRLLIDPVPEAKDK